MGLKQDLKKLYDDLDYWIYIGIGDDIVKCKDQRPEYKSLVQYCINGDIDPDKIPRVVKYLLYKEMSKYILFSKITWLVVYIKVKRKLFKNGL